MIATPQMILVLVLVSIALPVLIQLLLRGRPELMDHFRDRWDRGGWPSQEDFLIGFPLFIVFCGILMGWLLLFVGFVKQRMLG